MDRGQGLARRLGPRGPIPLDPAASVLHYAQEIFEGPEGV
jgi:branched-chain amino acid aminotransferase